MSLKRLLIHITYWIIFFITYPIFIIINQRGLSGVTLETFLAYVQNIFLHAGTLIPTVYIIFYYLFPRYVLKQKQLLKFVFSYFFVTIFLILINNLFSYYILFPIFYRGELEAFKTYAWDLSYLLRTYFFISLEILFFAIFKFSKDYFTEYLKRESIQKEISEVKLRMLKAQLHPHFLFNTLNNIYSLSLDCKNKQLSESINKLSEILRFSLYDCNSKFISLKKELSVIKNYIELERLRYSNLEVNIDLPLNTEGCYTIPLLYFTFIENAFKHGTSKSAINKWIDIRLKILKEDILFTVKNGKSEIKQKDRLNYSKGIGLENARKRLDLYFGNKNYTLVVKDLSNSFEIELLHKRIDNYGKMLNS